MRFRRIVTVALVAALTAPGLAGCGFAKDAKPEPGKCANRPGLTLPDTVEVAAGSSHVSVQGPKPDHTVGDCLNLGQYAWAFVIAAEPDTLFYTSVNEPSRPFMEGTGMVQGWAVSFELPPGAKNIVIGIGGSQCRDAVRSANKTVGVKVLTDAGCMLAVIEIRRH